MGITQPGVKPTTIGSVGGTGEGPGGTTTVTGSGESEVAIPEFVTFDPEAYYISLQSAIDAAHKEGRFNIDLFNENFDMAKGLALRTQQTELEGLKSYLPQSSKLIRGADAQGNADILGYSQVFDARNQPAARSASLGNVQLRRSLFESTAPGAFDSVNSLRSGAEGDLERIRRRESKPLLTDILENVAARDARTRAADISNANGFGVGSSANLNLMDRFDVDTRLSLETADRQNARAGDAAIQNAQNQISNTITQSENLFNGVLAPGIQDFRAIQATPRVTDIAGQIRAMPTTDAGTLQKAYTGDLTNISAISPSQVFSGSIDVQKYNSGVGIQALGFEQAQNNTVANGLNTAASLDAGNQLINAQIAAFNAGLQQQQASQNAQSTTGLITAGAGIIGSLLQGSGSTNAQSGGQSGGSIISDIISGITGLGKDAYNGLSSAVKNTTGFDIGQFSTDAAVNDQVLDTHLNYGSSVPPATSDFLNQISSGSAATFPDLSSQLDFGSPSVPVSVPVDLQLSDLSNSDFNLSSGSSFSLGQIERAPAESTFLPTKAITNSFVDTGSRSSITAELPKIGMDLTLAAQGYNIFDNWDKWDDKTRATQGASFLNGLASTAGLIDGTIPGAVVGVLGQGSNLFSNFDKMNSGQRVQASAQVAGALGTLAAGLAGAGGPVGAAIAFGAAAFGRAANQALTGGIDGNKAFSVIANPLQSYGIDSINSLIGNKIGKNDAANLALLSSPLTTPLAIGNMIFGLDLDFSTGKPKTQQFRDALRSGLKRQGVISGDYKMKLADGKTFDIGKDGNAKLPNFGKNLDGKTDRHYYDADFSNPNTPQVIGWTNVASRVLFRSEEGGKFVGHLTNAVMSSDPNNLKLAKENTRLQIVNAGINYATGVDILNGLLATKQIGKSDYEAYRNGWMDLMLNKDTKPYKSNATSPNPGLQQQVI